MIIEKGHGKTDKLIQFINNNYSRNKIIIICGSVNSKRIALNIADKIQSNTSIFTVEDSAKSIEEVFHKLDSDSVIIGVGGGKLMDLSKELSFRKSLKLILFPTIISNDGLANGLVVLNSVNNSKSIYRKPADHIFIDFDFIKSAPKKYLVSALGDVFSNYSAINDFVNQKENYTTIEFSKATESVLNSLSIIESEGDIDIGKVVNAIIESGKSVEVLKNSSAISGSEHLILHSTEKLYPNKKINHGIAVASITLFTLYLQSKLEYKHIKFLEENNISTIFTELFELNGDQLFQIFDQAKKYRINRITILNKYKTSELMSEFLLFEKKAKNMS